MKKLFVVCAAILALVAATGIAFASTAYGTETIFGTGSQRVSVALPPNTLYWEVEIYGDADIASEFPLYLYRNSPSGRELIGLCGAPVYSPSGNLSYCMTTSRYTGPAELDVEPADHTGWVLNVRSFAALYTYFLPEIHGGTNVPSVRPTNTPVPTDLPEAP